MFAKQERRAAELMAKYAGGTILEGSAEFNVISVEPAIVSITLDKINASIGTNITSSEVMDIFTRLKFNVTCRWRNIYCERSNTSWGYYH